MHTRSTRSLWLSLIHSTDEKHKHSEDVPEKGPNRVQSRRLALSAVQSCQLNLINKLIRYYCVGSQGGSCGPSPPSFLFCVFVFPSSPGPADDARDAAIYVQMGGQDLWRHFLRRSRGSSRALPARFSVFRTEPRQSSRFLLIKEDRLWTLWFVDGR